MIEVRPVETARDRRDFIRFPAKLYRTDPHWAPPLWREQKRLLDPERGPFFRHGEASLFVATRDGQPVGRISAHIDRRRDEIHADGKGFFGFFDCEDDREVAQELACSAEAWLRSRGCTSIEGPFNFTVHDDLGVLVEGFDSIPYVLTTYNKPYYARLLEEAGYQKVIDWHAFRTDPEMAMSGWPHRLDELRERVLRRPSFEIRQIDLEEFDENAQLVKRVFNSAWEDSWDHVPMGDAEFLEIAEGLRHLIIPELSFFAVVDGVPVGFVVSVRDPNPALRRARGRLLPLGWFHLWRTLSRRGRFRVMLLGVLPPHRGRGYEIVLYTEVIFRAIELGYPEAEMSVVEEGNVTMSKAFSRFPCERYRTYRIFAKRLRP